MTHNIVVDYVILFVELSQLINKPMNGKNMVRKLVTGRVGRYSNEIAFR